MLPLRFPNSDIIAKRGGGVVNHGQAVAKAPCKGVADCGQSQPAREADDARRGSSPQGRPAPLAGVVARRGGAYGHGWLWPARRGGSRPRAHPLAARCPQGDVTRSQPYSRGGGAGHKGGRPLARWLPTGKGSCCLRRGSSGGDADGARGVRASF
ncbi:hypothetical protein BHE74_00037590 [Ensete ventricosum]|nr:hypothetical protein BHE74_00037590 [Ensete ventricosum]